MDSQSACLYLFISLSVLFHQCYTKTFSQTGSFHEHATENVIQPSTTTEILASGSPYDLYGFPSTKSRSFDLFSPMCAVCKWLKHPCIHMFCQRIPPFAPIPPLPPIIEECLRCKRKAKRGSYPERCMISSYICKRIFSSSAMCGLCHRLHDDICIRQYCLAVPALRRPEFPGSFRTIASASRPQPSSQTSFGFAGSICSTCKQMNDFKCIYRWCPKIAYSSSVQKTENSILPISSLPTYPDEYGFSYGNNLPKIFNKRGFSDGLSTNLAIGYPIGIGYSSRKYR